MSLLNDKCLRNPTVFLYYFIKYRMFQIWPKYFLTHKIFELKPIVFSMILFLNTTNSEIILFFNYLSGIYFK